MRSRMPRSQRPRRIPLFRLGLTLLIGSVFVSVVKFYLGVGEAMGDMSGEAPSTRPRDLARYFVDDFLFAGTVAGVLFWVAIALCLMGALRMFAGGRKKT